MFDLNLKATATFSFSKLNDNLDRIIKEAASGSAENVAKRLKKNIDGQNFKPLTKTTQRLRKSAGYNTFYPSIKPKDTTTILKATGKLYDSIKATDKGVSFNHYGHWHVTGEKGRPLRNWMQGTVGVAKGGKQQIVRGEQLRRLQEDIKKSFKIPKKTLREMKF